MVTKQYDHVKEREKVFQLMNLNTKHILDLGICGCDCMTMVLARNGYEVTSIDDSEEKLKEAKKFAEKEGLSKRIDFYCEDAANLAFADDSFEAVVAYNLLHYCENIARVILEMFRVCKSGGKIIISELNADGRRAAKHQEDPEFLNKIQELIERWSREIKVFDLEFTRVWVVKK